MRSTIVLGVVATGVLAAASPAAAATTSCSDLSAAIVAANAAPGADVIDLPAGAVCRIAEPLPTVTDELRVDGHGATLRPAPGTSPYTLFYAEGEDRFFTLTLARMTLARATAAASSFQASITFDQANVHDNGVGADVIRGSATAVGSRIARNGAGLVGGGAGFASVTDSTLVDNGTGVTAAQDTFVADSLVTRNTVGIDAVENVNVLRSRITKNGTGVSSRDYVGLASSRLVDNQVALRTSSIVVGQTLIARNGQVGGPFSANVGGSTFFGNGEPLSAYNAQIVNTTFARGEGLDVSSGEVSFSTITGTLNAKFPMTLSSSIVLDCTGTFDPSPSGATNVSPDAECPDLAVTGDPRLRALRDNGGPTPTIALRPNSPAIDVVPLAACSIAFDQRNLPRPAGPACDAGAYEVQAGSYEVDAGGV